MLWCSCFERWRGDWTLAWLRLGGFQFLHFLSQCPQGAVDVGVLVDASDFAGAAAGYEAAVFVALDIAKATTDEVFLNCV